MAATCSASARSGERRPPGSPPSRTKASRGVTADRTTSRGSASAGSTAPPGKTCMSPANAIDAGRCVSRTSRPPGPGRMSTTVAAGRGSTRSTATLDTLAGAAAGTRIERLDLDDLARRNSRRATERDPDGEERRHLDLLPGRHEVPVAAPDHEDGPIADQRFDPALTGDPALVADVRVVDDEDIRPQAEHLLAMPERRRRVPLRQDRGVLRQGCEDHVHVIGSGEILAAIRCAPVHQPEKERERQADTTDGEPDL